MKGYRTQIRAGFEMGLRGESVTKRNTGLLLSALGSKIRNKTLLGYTPEMVNLLDSAVGSNLIPQWPFPQLFLTDAGLYIGHYDGLYEVTAIAAGSLTLSTLYSGTITYPWSCAKIPVYPAFASGNVFVYYESASAAYRAIEA